MALRNIMRHPGDDVLKKKRKLQVQVGHPVVDSAPIINLGRGQSHRLCL